MKNFFRNVSWIQLFSSALAAVTAFFFSSKIGVAGSAIGAALGSIVSAIASQIYENVLDASTHKIQETVIGPVNSDKGDDVKQGESDDKGDFPTTELIGINEKTHAVSPRAASVQKPRLVSNLHKAKLDGITNKHDSVEHTSVLPVLGEAETTKVPRVTVPENEIPGAESNPIRRAQSKRSFSNRIQNSSPSQNHISSSVEQSVGKRKQMLIVVSVVSAIVAVLLSVVVINVLTKGEGTDHVVRDIVRPSPTVQVPQEPTSSPNSSPMQSPGQGDRSTPKKSEEPSPSTSNTPSPSPTNSSESPTTPTDKPSEKPTDEPTPNVSPSPVQTPNEQQRQHSNMNDESFLDPSNAIEKSSVTNNGTNVDLTD